MLHQMGGIFDCNSSCWNLSIISEKMQHFLSSCSHVPFSPLVVIYCYPFSCTNWSIFICFSINKTLKVWRRLFVVEFNWLWIIENKSHSDQRFYIANQNGVYYFFRYFFIFSKVISGSSLKQSSPLLILQITWLNRRSG